MRARLLVGPLLLVMSGCSGGEDAEGPASVDRADVQAQVSSELARSVGRAPDQVSCPGDLAGVLGETMRCTLTDAGTRLGVAITVTRVKGDQVSFDIRVDPADAP